MVELEELGPPLPPPQASSDAAPPPQPAPPPRFDPSRMIGIIRRKALIKDLAAVYHAECLAYCQELLELQRKWEEKHKNSGGFKERNDEAPQTLEEILLGINFHIPCGDAFSILLKSLRLDKMHILKHPRVEETGWSQQIGSI
ncbi:unnamed protein product [Camellia sinensis]